MMIKIGDNITYISKTGQKYLATIISIPEEGQGNHGPEELTVGLEFRNTRGKLVRKDRVLNINWSNSKTKCWTTLVE
jgi:hypothetical protein